MKEYGEMQFMASSPPAADAGEYRVKVHQNVTSPVAEEIPGAEFRFLREKSGLNWNRGRYTKLIHRPVWCPIMGLHCLTSFLIKKRIRGTGGSEAARRLEKIHR